jgi:hypothetical protein
MIAATANDDAAKPFVVFMVAILCPCQSDKRFCRFRRFDHYPLVLAAPEVPERSLPDGLPLPLT